MQNSSDTIKFLIANAYRIAKQHGWHDKERPVPELLCLMHSEISEALEEYRDGHEVNEIYYGPNGKPEGIPIELADILIRIFDMCGVYGINLSEALGIKMAYNETREYRHGNKRV